MTGIFAKYANDFIDSGMSIFPCGGDDGKKPKVRWKEYQHDIADVAVIDKWLKQYSNQNIGMITGRISNITVLDCDDPDKTLDFLQKEYGKSAFIVETPRGGLHLYYKYNGERNTVNSEIKVDVRGEGGFVVSPYSYNPKLKKSYKIVKGSLDDLENLPRLESFPTPSVSTIQSNKILNGDRNNTLFKLVKDKAIFLQSKDELRTFAYAENNKIMETPLTDCEVENIVNTVWGYKEKGTLRPSGQSYFQISEQDFRDLTENPDALTLFLFIIKYHRGVRTEFNIVQIHIGVKLKWDSRRVKNAITVLIRKNKIRLLRKGIGKGNGHLYTFV